MEEKNEIKEEKREKIGIKIPRWASCLILLVFIAYSIFLIYRTLNKKSIETVEILEDNSQFIISCDKEEINIGEILKINVSKYKKDYILVSSNPEVVSVENNNVTGITEGDATIYALHGEEKSNEINIKCLIKLEKLVLDKTNVDMKVGESVNLKCSLIPENATNKEVIWKSFNENIATVENGEIKAINVGKTNIIASNVNETITAICEVNVKPVEVASLTLDDSNVNLGVGQAYILKETINPDNATNKEITWTSSNEEVIAVNKGEIKAKSEGEATVTITSNNGKTATCKFNVTQTAPNNPVKYATDSFNVRTGPGTNYKWIASVSKSDEIEILKEEKNYIKLRLSNGIVGYTISKAYSSTKSYYIENVPYINQFSLGYPTGCEAVSAAMAAQYAGYNVSVATIIANTPTDTLGKREEIRTKEVQKEIINEETGEIEIQTITEEETIWIGGDPFKVFVGHPTKGLSTGSYGCFAAPIVTALQSSGISSTNISGCSIDTLFNYIKQGKPVIVWCKKNAGDLVEGVTWQYPDGSGEYVELIGEHCAVLIGYDENYVYLNDPSAGNGVKQAKWKFTSNWYKLYSQAIVIN